MEEQNGTKYTNVVGYHPAIVGPDEAWKGKTWKQMPGRNSEFLQRCIFFLFRRGLHSGLNDGPGNCDEKMQMMRLAKSRESNKRKHLERKKQAAQNQSIADS